MTHQPVSMTADALARRADIVIDFIHDDTCTSGQAFFAGDYDIFDCRHGVETELVSVELIGVIVEGDEYGTFAAPEILTADDAYDRFGFASVKAWESEARPE